MNSELVAQALEQFEHAAGRLAGGGEELHAGVVGLIFLSTHIGEQRALDRGLRGHDGRGADAAVAGARADDHGADAGQHGDDRGGLRLRKLFAQAHQMTAGEMPRFMRENADNLVRRLGFEQRAGIDEDVAAVHDESVEGAVVEDDDLDVLLGEAGCLQDRRGVVTQ